MLLKNQIVKMTWNNKSKKYYESKGYKFTKRNDEFYIKAEDLHPNSHINVKYLCDNCGKELIKSFRRIKEKDYCIKCKAIESKKTCIEKYGIENPSQLQEVKDKKKNTFLKNYGVEHFSKTEDYHIKYINTNLKRYGVKYPLQSQIIKEKMKLTNIKRYGVEYGLQNKDIREKCKQTMLRKYGVTHNSKCKEIRERQIMSCNKTLYKNGTAPSSKQQNYLHQLLGGKLNYPIDKCRLDIAFPREMIYIEYNGSGHDLRLQRSSITEKEFLKKEIKREMFLQSKGWKLIRIISKKDLLLLDKDTISLIDDAKNYLLSTNHHWFEINIDNRTIKCKEYEKKLDNKDFIRYSYYKEEFIICHLV